MEHDPQDVCLKLIDDTVNALDTARASLRNALKQPVELPLPLALEIQEHLQALGQTTAALATALEALQDHFDNG